jgi:hypothetical protein
MRTKCNRIAGTEECYLVAIDGELENIDWLSLTELLQSLCRGIAKAIVLDWRESSIKVEHMVPFLEAVEMQRTLTGTIIENIGSPEQQREVTANCRLSMNIGFRDSIDEAVWAVRSTQAERRKSSEAPEGKGYDHDLELGDLGVYGFDEKDDETP